jgi:putative Holliday junction resolvase
MRYLGIDYGSKKIGLALSDENGTMGFPHSIILNTPGCLEAVALLIAKENVGTVVLGESKMLSGKENPIMEAARAFGEELTTRTGIPVRYESEVFTTIESRRPPAKLIKSRSMPQKTPVDDRAAALILTSYLSHTNHD